MPKNKGRLKMALAAEKGVDFRKLNQEKRRKEAEKKKAARAPTESKAKPTAAPAKDDEWEDDDEDSEGEESDSDDNLVDRIAALNDSDVSDSEVEMEEKIMRKPKASSKAGKTAQEAEEEEDEDEEDEDDEDIPLSDVDEREDIIPHTRLTINNTNALQAALNRIALPKDKSTPFVTHMSISGLEPTADSIEDVQDDLKRELALYSQSLDAAKRARALLKAEGAPFSRPKDYFAEMVKDDGHMEKVKAKLVEEASNKKAAQEARKLRDLKKFGKQVQVSKLQERQKDKRETLEKIKVLKRKRTESSGDLGEKEADLFDVGVENEIQGHGGKGGRGRDGDGPRGKRQKKDSKFGFGGKKKHSKSGDALSSGDMSGFSAKRMKTGAKGKTFKTARLGKSKRQAGGKR